MDWNDTALNIHAARGFAVIRLGFSLNKKPNKTPREALAARAFLQTFWSTLGIVLAFTVVLFFLIGYTVNGPSEGFQGDYAEARTGRMEDGQVRYVKNELYYISPEEIGLSADLPDGTHINLYFDENGNVIAGENADERDQVMERRVVLTVAAMGAMVITLIVFAVVARKTFGKPWFEWLQAVRNAKQ